MGLDLSSRQKMILEVIKNQIEIKGYPPCVREICKEVGLKSTSTVHSHLEKLEKKGYIQRDPAKPRAIEVLDPNSPKGINSIKQKMVNVPVIKEIIDGESILSRENIQEHIPLSQSFLRVGDNFILKVKGDSMIDVGILNGDNVIVNKRDSAFDDQIVVAILHKEYVTVKKFFKENDMIRLKPENKSMDSILLSSKDVEVVGIVGGVFR